MSPVTLPAAGAPQGVVRRAAALQNKAKGTVQVLAR